MRTPFVNGLVMLALAAGMTACSKADGRPRDTAVVVDSLSTRADLGRIAGAATAKVWVVEVSDFQCPYCKEWHDESYAKIRDEFVKPGRVRFAFVNFPMSQHLHSRDAATAAMCASAQGKFWEMHDSLFTNQNVWERLPSTGEYFESLATKIGVNVPTWKSCLTAKPVQAMISADMDRARRAGVEATPSFLIGGKLISGAMEIDEMRKAINDALAGR